MSRSRLDSPFDTDTDPEPETPGTDLRTLLLGGLSRSLGWVLFMTALGALAGVIVGLMQPNLYESNAKLLLRVGARELLTSESMLGEVDDPRVSAPTVADEIQMLSDVGLYEKVARHLGPEAILRPADPGREDGPDTPFYGRFMHTAQARLFGALPDDHDCSGATCATCLRKAAKALDKRTVLDAEAGSNVIRVHSVSTSPELAQRTVQALADAYIDRHREQYSIQALVERNRPKVQQAKSDRDAAAVAYLEHINRTGIEGGEPQLAPTSSAELSALEDKLWEARLQLEQVRDRRQAIASRSDGQPDPVQTFGPVVMVPNEAYESLLAQKLGLLAERRARPAPSPSRTRLLDERIAEIEESLSRMPTVVAKATEGRMLVAADEQAPPTAGIDLAADEHALELKIQALTARYEEKKARSDDTRRQNLLLEQERKDLAVRRDNAEVRYKQLQDRFANFEALGAIDVNEEANLRVLQAPTIERDKVGPERGTLLLKGLLVGLLVGAVIAVARHKLDTRVRYPELCEHNHGLPVLGVVPRHSSLRELSRAAHWEEN
jgi:uncharacterized protein involved in exopolysaccharide biosynthesis